ncbi:hypothetical protein FPV67DRAFT_1460851 [Lyophyllum atratum]|nr:hypothetical protein FPV67DRAFT_1460851 [Lyophyllum atratum]
MGNVIHRTLTPGRECARETRRLCEDQTTGSRGTTLYKINGVETFTHPVSDRHYHQIIPMLSTMVRVQSNSTLGARQVNWTHTHFTTILNPQLASAHNRANGGSGYLPSDIVNTMESLSLEIVENIVDHLYDSKAEPDDPEADIWTCTAVSRRFRLTAHRTLYRALTIDLRDPGFLETCTPFQHFHKNPYLADYVRTLRLIIPTTQTDTRIENSFKMKCLPDLPSLRSLKFEIDGGGSWGWVDDEIADVVLRQMRQPVLSTLELEGIREIPLEIFHYPLCIESLTLTRISISSGSTPTLAQGLAKTQGISTLSISASPLTPGLHLLLREPSSPLAIHTLHKLDTHLQYPGENYTHCQIILDLARAELEEWKLEVSGDKRPLPIDVSTHERLRGISFSCDYLRAISPILESASSLTNLNRITPPYPLPHAPGVTYPGKD